MLLNGGAMPNLTNSAPFAAATWATDQFIGTPLDASIVDALLNDPNNRGLLLHAPENGSNWPMAARERAGGSQAAYIEVTIATDAAPVPALSAWGWLAFVLAVAGAGAALLRRRACGTALA